MIRWYATGTSIAGRRFAIFILLTPSMLRPIPNMSKLPTTLISDITCCVSMPLRNPAPRVIAPWYISTEMADIITPMPIVDANIMADTPSRTDFANSVLWSPLSPLSSAPTIAIAPTQYISVQLTKPSATLPPLPLKSSSRRSPNLISLWSISITSPITPPMTMENITSSRLASSRAPLIPMRTTHSAIPFITVSLNFSVFIPLIIIPAKLPATIAATLTSVPIIQSPPF
ncbi:hypothetical protein EAL2_c11710 [Peptoclostridium acidaminophilum DSM 3953]|uniref:Uncharacterized protein n=1 Tax=Peptoclostridium acidaminophilum DSM 3953 TaxID=1286171 RepID=W8TJR9_PEPAC|nr:hypothetical protein EAL2_c11710 [Peptoclostridium acidaminophilum DSM 3953]